HTPRVRLDPFVPDVPEPEALEQHPDALAALRNTVQVAEEVEVLECGQLPVHEWLVRQQTDAAAIRPDLERAARRSDQAGDDAQQGRLTGSVCSLDNEEVAGKYVERAAFQDA